MRRTRSVLTKVVRWWLGVTYLAAGVGGVIAIPFMIASGNEGWVYFVVAAPLIAVLGWVVHPWGLQRHRLRARGSVQG